MEKIVRQLPKIDLPKPKQKKVCGYCRVSTGKEMMLHSLSVQVSYFNDLIQKTPGWEFSGVYADEARTGTKDNRPQFMKMLADCRAGKIDMILTKSISRFARNTVTLLSTARELKALGVDIYFEEQNIHTISGEGEMLLSLLAAHAQAESESMSENIKWKIRNDFKKGIPQHIHMLGYRHVNGELIMVPEEAEIVRKIYSLYLHGYGYLKIAKTLNEAYIPSYTGGIWHQYNVSHILRNEKYTGVMLLQKTYRKDPITKKKCINKGELPQYYISESHAPIIDSETFEKVQAEIERRATPPLVTGKHYFFSGKIKCGNCGKNFRKKRNNIGKNSKYARSVWACATYNTRGKQFCSAKQIPETVLQAKCCEVLGLDEFDGYEFEQNIDYILVIGDSTLEFHFYDGRVVTTDWSFISRSESWTADMKSDAAVRIRRQFHYA